MDVVECYYGKGDRRRVIGWLVEGIDGFLRYVQSGPRDPVRIVWPDGRLFDYYQDDGRWEAA
jgi:hypothetical protein